MQSSVNGCYSGGVKCNFVYYYGRRYGSDKEVFWRDADIFVFPSFYPNECFPLVLLEAMEHGVVCISTREGGIPDIIEDGKTGLIVERNTPEQLAEKIEELIKNPDLTTTFGALSRQRFVEQFTLDVFEKNMNVLLDDIMKKHNI